ncbi:putative ABC transport system permease protein [Streptoalloteichus tenebrarius]|uniref:ABC transport system permease protein n=1 Tax=Streptoalloteichus tenebrarius (strain ATCC 17920 / DSM 40477 / JCM 4838 / CBS 697.72 / NBRC 16177 / NCIMB 11028 / NRRL B-12390 / A12253. 1 / ISP 5477) TaxID=1933 RepID=A0ABT1HTZ2_STRSD|nr:FtsX-like permease family protein [Streptoalloteichus tenebrarius]MCP2258972.1 putative ABC transport system permease protein [Streptoalloteichus tenebrarius]BFF01181.1 ABC transporter permease [Streptoalloteichus tenebrarius]
MLSLSLRTLRTRAGGFVGAFVALLLASAVVTACGVLLESGIRGGPRPERLAGADVVITGDRQAKAPPVVGGDEPELTEPDLPDQRFAEVVRPEAAVVERVRAVPGVRAAVPDLSFPAHVVVDGQPVAGVERSLGHGWDSAQLTPFTLRAGRAPAAEDEVVVDAALAARARLGVGDQARIQVDGEPRPHRVVGIVAPPAGDGLERQAALFFAPSTAERLAGHAGWVDAVGVLAAPGTDGERLGERIAQALHDDRLVALVGDDRGQAEFPREADRPSLLILVSTQFGVIVVLVAVFVVAGTLALSVRHRHREMALLRAIGATPRQVLRMVTGEALVVASLASVLGTAPGMALAAWARDEMAARELVGIETPLSLSPLPALAAVVVGMLTAALAALSAGRRAGRVRPTEALREAAVEPVGIGRGRRIAGSVLLGLTGVLVVVTVAVRNKEMAAVAAQTVLLLVIAIALLGPAVARGITALLGWPLRTMFGATGYLAAENTRANTRRLASVITPLVLCVGFAAAVLGVQATALTTAERDQAASSRADQVLVSTTGGLPPTVAEAARRVPGVVAATGTARTNIVVEGTSAFDPVLHTYDATALGGPGVEATLDLDVRSGRLADLGGDGVALSVDAAGTLDAAVGDRVTVKLGDNTPAELRVVAVYDRSAGFGDAVLPRERVAGHTTTGLDDAVLIRFAEGADRSAAAAALRELSSRYAGAHLVDAVTTQTEQVRALRQSAWLNLLLVAMIIAYTAVAVVTTLAMATSDRAREFALLRLVGTTRSQVLRMVRWEGLLVVVASVGLGALVAAATLVPFSLSLAGSALPALPPLAYLLIPGGAAALALLGTLFPARLALRTHPADAIGTKE